MAALTHRLITVEEYEKLTENDKSVRHELRHGVIVEVAFSRPRHNLTQSRLRDLIRAAAPAGSYVEIEFAFRPIPEYELRGADVAYISKERWAAQDLDKDFFGVPALVIEVLSPSNTRAEINDKKQLCLENGAEQFWVVDLKRQQVSVSTPDGQTTVYRSGQRIPLTLFGGGAEIAVEAIFE